MRKSYNWSAIRERIMSIIRSQTGNWPTYAELSEILDIPQSTLHDNIDMTKIIAECSRDFQVNMTTEMTEIKEESYFPKTPEDLAERAGIDLSKYNIRTFECFAREVYVKDIEKDLLFDEGKITGHVRDSGQMTLRTIWSSRIILDLLVVKPRALSLVPIVINMPESGTIAVPQTVSEEHTLIIPDIHFGFGDRGQFHDGYVLEKLLELVNELFVDKIVILGDMLDMTEFTDRFITEPNAIRSTQAAFMVCAEFLAALRQVSDCPIYWLEGNHERRLTDQLRKHMSAIAGIHVVGEHNEAISIPYLLNLKQLAVEYIPNWPQNFYDVGEVHIVHGDSIGSGSGHTVGKMLSKHRRSTIFGHIHRREYAETAIWSDAIKDYKTIFSYSPGCLCKTDGTVPGSSPDNGWGQGVGILVHDAKNNVDFITDIPYSGKVKRFLK